MTITQKELTQRQHQYSEIISGFRVRRVFALLPWFLPAFAYMMLHAWYLQPILSAGWRELSAVTAMSLLMITIIWCAYRTHIWQTKLATELDLLCPHCHHPFIGKRGSDSIASGQCVFCGKKFDAEARS